MTSPKEIPISEVNLRHSSNAEITGTHQQSSFADIYGRVVQKLDAYAADSYVEGIACLGSGLLIEHGWVCRPDGTIMDPTLPTDEGVYFPGLEFRGRTGICEFLATPRGRKCKNSPFIYAFGWGGRYSPGIMRAWEQGNAHLRELYPEAFKIEE